ncbi:MAG: hypothetical protein JXR78_00135 [Victivallales bacterium]|nr:hypothetical protein [Victivallales bacterium]
MVMGNGNFGALVWGVDTLNVTVNRSDFWDHRGGELIVPGTTYEFLVKVAQEQDANEALSAAILRETYPDNVFKPQRLPVGRFEFSFVPNIHPVRAKLDYHSGTVTVELSDASEVLLDLSLSESLLLVRDSAGRLADVNIKPAWDFSQSREWLEQYAFLPPERFSDADGCGWIQSCPVDPSLACVCRKVANGYALALELGENNAEARSKADQVISVTKPEELLNANLAWWTGYWTGVPEISLPDEWFEKFYKYAVYKFAAATHPDGYPCGLQGPWHEEYRKAEWSGDFHFNVNVQEIYTPAFALGKQDHLMPLFDMIESEPFMSGLRHNAKVMFGVDDALWFTHAVDDRGQQCGWLIPGSVLDPACGAWTAQLYWNYYRYSGDMEFLRDRAFPFIRGIMRGYECMMEEYQGRLSIPLAISAEYGCSNSEAGQAGRDPSYQLAAVHMLADYLIDAAGLLNLDVEPAWLDIKTRLPEYSLVERPGGSGGTREKRIAVWENQDLDVCHRHHSHLAAIYPFETLSNPDPEQAEIIDNSIDHLILKGMGQWSEWCMPWAAIIYSRLGFHDAPMILLNMWKEVFVNEGWATVYLPRTRGIVAHRRHDLKKPKATSEIMQLDGTMGAVSALTEMLVHQRGDTVYLFEGIPDKWQEASFSNVHLPGALTVSATRKHGRTVSVQIKSVGDGSIKIKLPENISPITVDLEAGKEKNIDGTAD